MGNQYSVCMPTYGLKILEKEFHATDNDIINMLPEK